MNGVPEGVKVLLMPEAEVLTEGAYVRLREIGDWMQVKFQGAPGTLSFGLKGNGTSATNVSTFAVLESADGEAWTPVATFTSDDNLTNSRQDVSYALSEDSRYVQFLYQEKGDCNVGNYDVYISEAGEAPPTVTVTGETTLILGGTFELALALENYTGDYEWAWAPETVGYVDSDTATFWWTPTAIGETDVTFSAMDGGRTIASETVTLTVAYAPALVFGGVVGYLPKAVTLPLMAQHADDPSSPVFLISTVTAGLFACAPAIFLLVLRIRKVREKHRQAAAPPNGPKDGD